MIEKFQQRFIEEARENCDRLEQYLLELEEDIDNQSAVDEIFRILHSLKGSGGMFGFHLLSEFTHELESVYQFIRDGRLALDSKIVGFTLRCNDVLRNLLNQDIPENVRQLVHQLKGEASLVIFNQVGTPRYSDTVSDNHWDREKVKENKTWYIFFSPDQDIFGNGTNPLYLVDELNTLGDCQIEADLSKVPLPDCLQVGKCYTVWRAILTTDSPRTEIEDIFLFVRDTSRVEILEIPEAIIHNEEMLLKVIKEDPEAVAEKIRVLSEVRVPGPVPGQHSDDNAPATIRVDSARIDDYMNLVSEMITVQSRLFSLAEARNDKELIALAGHFDRLTHQMRDNAFDMSLIPLYSIVTRFRRLVRDLSSELHKEVRLELNGLETEVDKNVIERLVSPLIHIIRNCVDHGIETPEERISRGKNPEGRILVSAGYAGNFVEIKVEDDGRGLDFDRIWQKAVQKGLLSEADPMVEGELAQIIFKAGFTTSEQLTDVSGRGTGLDAARKAIDGLRGRIDVETTKGRGTSFAIKVPLTLSIIDGLQIRIRDDIYIIPLACVQKIYPLKNTNAEKGIRQAEIAGEKQLSYLDLGMEFYGIPKHGPQQYLIAVNYKDELFGLAVDDIMREYQAVVKPVGKLTQNGRLFMGACILGDGKAALVLDVNTIIQKLVH